jgi:hypothetical protein
MDGEKDLTREQLAFGRKLMAVTVRSFCAAGLFWVGATTPWTGQLTFVMPIIAFGSGIVMLLMAIHAWRKPTVDGAATVPAPDTDATSKST